MRRRSGSVQGPFFIFDVQVHYVGSGYDPDNTEAGRKGAVTKQTTGAAQAGTGDEPAACSRPRHPGRPLVGEFCEGGLPR